MVTAPPVLRRNRIRTPLTVLLGLALLSLYLPVRQHSRAASLLLHIGDRDASGIVADYDTRPVRVAPTTIEGPAGPIRATMYIPEETENPPAMVVLHGVHHGGIEEPRLVAFSRALASHGIIILTPEMADLADYHVDPNAFKVIGASVHALAQRTGAQKVGLLGLSFAGGLALIAATDPESSEEISFVVAVGAHHNIERVLRFYVTNEIPRVDGSTLKMQAHEYGALVVVYSHPELFFDEHDVEPARQAIRLWLWEKFDAAREGAKKLSPAGQAKLTQLFDHHRDVMREELLAGIQTHPEEVTSVSPAGKLSVLRVPVLLVHGAGDSVIPPSETEWLAREVPKDLLREVLLSPAISHVEVGGKGPTLRDKLNLVHFMAEMLSEADNSPRSTVAPAALLQPAAAPHASIEWSH